MPRFCTEHPASGHLERRDATAVSYPSQYKKASSLILRATIVQPQVMPATRDQPR
jgi:hypothetical protein